MAIACGCCGIFDEREYVLESANFNFFGKNCWFCFYEAIFSTLPLLKMASCIIRVASGRLSPIRAYPGVADRKARSRLVNWHDFCLATLATKQRADDL